MKVNNSKNSPSIKDTNLSFNSYDWANNPDVKAIIDMGYDFKYCTSNEEDDYYHESYLLFTSNKYNIQINTYGNKLVLMDKSNSIYFYGDATMFIDFELLVALYNILNLINK